MAPVTLDVFSSARPTVTAILFCPDAANASRATIVNADMVKISSGDVIHCSKAATSIKMAWKSVDESSHARRRAEE